MHLKVRNNNQSFILSSIWSRYQLNYCIFHNTEQLIYTYVCIPGVFWTRQERFYVINSQGKGKMCKNIGRLVDTSNTGVY